MKEDGKVKEKAIKLHYGPTTWPDGTPLNLSDADFATETSCYINAGIKYITAVYPSGYKSTWPAPGQTGCTWHVKPDNPGALC